VKAIIFMMLLTMMTDFAYITITKARGSHKCHGEKHF